MIIMTQTGMDISDSQVQNLILFQDEDGVWKAQERLEKRVEFALYNAKSDNANEKPPLGQTTATTSRKSGTLWVQAIDGGNRAEVLDCLAERFGKASCQRVYSL